MEDKYGASTNLNKELQWQIRLSEDNVSFSLEIKVPNPVVVVRERFKPDFDLSGLNIEMIGIVGSERT